MTNLIELINGKLFYLRKYKAYQELMIEALLNICGNKTKYIEMNNE